MTNQHDAPIACTLTGGGYTERLAWIARLNRDGLRSCRREAMSLQLHYTADVRERVYELVRNESMCCAFLMFAIDESTDDVCVNITVPERARDVVEEVLAPFLAAGKAESSRPVGDGGVGGERCVGFQT